MSRIDDIIQNTIGKEGKYSNNPKDSGGETMWGITVAVARKNGYSGPMKDMPRDTAAALYLKEYFVNPGFDKILLRSPSIAEELFDTGVNMGTTTATKFLQHGLNLFNKQATLYADIDVDGGLGAGTLAAFDAYIKARGTQGELVMMRFLNAAQGGRYADITEAAPKNEEFIFGWFLNRVVV